jgi:hypothetical protein
VLHVATTVYETGGHARLIESWLKNDGVGRHSLVLLDQRDHRVRTELVEQIDASGGELIVLPADSSIMGRARRLRQAALAGYDCIILHQHPNDVVPLVALAVPECPAVAVMNHADHVFWLGASVADAVIEFRRYGARLSCERRGARPSLMFPLPLNVAFPPLHRADARARLGIPDSEVMLLSIGSAYKYTPTKTHNFFRALHRVLTANPTARLFVVGVDQNDFRSFGVPPHDRMELLGSIPDPSLYEAAADLYLESFPLGSYTALFETAARAVCPILMFAPASHTNIADDVPLEGLLTNPTDEANYVACVTALINDPATRTKLGRAVARQVDAFHGREEGRAYLQRIYAHLAGTTHKPALLPAQQYAETTDDLSLANFNNVRIKTAVLQEVANDALAQITFSDLLRLFAISLRTRDTRLTPAHMKTWLGLFRRKIFPSRPPSGNR